VDSRAGRVLANSAIVSTAAPAMPVLDNPLRNAPKPSSAHCHKVKVTAADNAGGTRAWQCFMPIRKVRCHVTGLIGRSLILPPERGVYAASSHLFQAVIQVRRAPAFER